MPRLKPDTQRQRRAHIVDAAELCFARTGFHRTTMQDICKQAGVSAGALYLYFDSKEALIAGIAERDRAEFRQRFEALAAAPDLMAALTQMGEQYFVDEPQHKRLMCIEIGLESTRNDKIGEIYRSVDRLVHGSFETLFRRLQAEGRIAPQMEVSVLARVFMTIGDGVFWRRAIDQQFDVVLTLPAVMEVIRRLINPVKPAGQALATVERETVETAQ